MLKRRDVAVRRRPASKGGWWKWKVEPYTVDAVMIYAQPGHGRARCCTPTTRSRVRDGERARAVREGVLGSDRRRDPRARCVDPPTHGREVRPGAQVKPEQVFELGFEGIQASPRHKSGVAVRFPRIAALAHGQDAPRTPTRSTRCARCSTAAPRVIDLAPRSNGSRRAAGRRSRFSARCGTRTCAARAGWFTLRPERGRRSPRGGGRCSNVAEWIAKTGRPRTRAAYVARRRRRCAFSGSRRSARSPATRARRSATGRRSRTSVDARVAHRRHERRAMRARQSRRLPTALVTTPESSLAAAHARRRARACSPICAPSSSTNGTS